MGVIMIFIIIFVMVLKSGSATSADLPFLQVVMMMGKSYLSSGGDGDGYVLPCFRWL